MHDAKLPFELPILDFKGSPANVQWQARVKIILKLLARQGQ